MVDTVLYLEGERYFSYRILRGVKNRFGSTNEIGMFEMKDKGMSEIDNPSDILISEREDNPSGSCVVATMEGTRPLLVELQALTSQTIFGYPRRAANGFDYNRLTLLIAVLEKKAGMLLNSQDIYLNVVGGLKVNEPAVDLGVIMVAASSFKNIPIPNKEAICAALYLLSADTFLWGKSVSFIQQDSIRFKEIKIHGVDLNGYVLFHTAKDLYQGTNHISISELIDPELVGDITFELIVTAFLIRRYGHNVLNAERMK